MCDHGPGPVGAVVLFVTAVLAAAAIVGVGLFFTAAQEARDFDRMEQHK